MYRSRRVLALLSVSIFACIAAMMNGPPMTKAEVDPIPSASSPCADCSAGILVPSSDDPVVRQRNLEIVQTAVRNRMKQIHEEHRKEGKRKFNSWQAPQVTVAETSVDPNACRAVAVYFAKVDPPAPQERIAEFAIYQEDGKRRCVRWDMRVESAKENDSGWEATIRVRPFLMRESGRVSFTPHTTLETWQVSKKGELTPLSVIVDQPQHRGMLHE